VLDIYILKKSIYLIINEKNPGQKAY